MSHTPQKFNHISREISTCIKKSLLSLRGGGIVFLYGESGSWKSVILSQLFAEFWNGTPLDLEDFDSLVEDWGKCIKYLEKRGLCTLPNIFNTTINEFNNNFGNTISNVSQEVENHFHLDQDTSRSMLLLTLKSAFENYQKPYIYLDAVEKIFWGKDAWLFEKILTTLQNNGVKVIMTSRNPYPIEANIEAIHIQKFDETELKTYLTTNMSSLAEHQALKVEQRVVYSDETTKQTLYDPLLLSLIFTLYQLNTDDFVTELEQLWSSNQIQEVLTLGGSPQYSRIFEPKATAIFDKIFQKNSHLLSYLKKTFLFKFHSSDLLDATGIPYSHDEWSAFEHFIDINGRRERHSKTKNFHLVLHGSLYHLIAKYFLSEQQNHPEQFEAYSPVYYSILDYWKGHRLEMIIQYVYLLGVYNAYHPLLVALYNPYGIRFI